MPIESTHLTPGQSLSGVEPDLVVQIVAVVPVGDRAFTLVYRLPDGGIRERLLTTEDLATISPATAQRPWSFDGDGAAFKLAVEAKRIDLAFLFDPMMAVHSSNVDPLPHQIAATTRIAARAEYPTREPEHGRLGTPSLLRFDHFHQTHWDPHHVRHPFSVSAR